MSRSSITVESPGRINIIGEHTDYNQGFVLPAAIDKRTTMQVERNDSDLVEAHAQDLNETHTFHISEFSPASGGWRNYVMGVIHELQKMGASFTGMKITFTGDIPIGSGMSSSAALECSLAYALNELYNLGFSDWQLIEASQMSEHHFVGIKCGIMDQFASIMGKKNHVMLLDCRSLDYTYYPFDAESYQLLLLNTNVSHTLASSEYNTRRAECEEGVKLLQNYQSGIQSLREVSLDQLMKQKDNIPRNIFQRCHHVITENDRVIQTTQALQEKDFIKVGQLMLESHYSLSKDYQVSCPELDFLVSAISNRTGFLGGRMMGGGFGGCTINLVDQDRVPEIIDHLSVKYKDQFGLELTPYLVSIEDGAKVVA